MILANDFLEYLLNTERDLAVRVRERYDMYLKSLPVPQLADGKIVIDGRYMIDSHEGNYRLYRIEGGTPSVIGIYQRPSSAIVDVIADSIRITHRYADTEDTVLEIQRLAAVCRDTLNGMTQYLKARADASGVTVGYSGVAARIARVHQFGERDQVAPGIFTNYPARELLGISQTDERLIYNTVLGRIAEAVR